MSIGKVIVVPEPLILLEYLSSINFWKQSCIGLLSIYEEGTLQLIFYKGFTFTVVIIPFELILAFLISIVVSLSLSLSLSRQSFTEEEMNKFEEDYEDYYDYDYDKDGNIIGFKTRSRETSKSTDKHPPQEQEPPGELG